MRNRSYLESITRITRKYIGKQDPTTDEEMQDWVIVHNTLLECSILERTILYEIYSDTESFPDAVEHAALKHDVSNNFVWGLAGEYIKRFLRRKRGGENDDPI